MRGRQNCVALRHTVENVSAAKRLVWSGMLAGVGALSTIVANKIATQLWVRIFNEDPPDY